MKFIHVADIHLGSRLKSKFPESLSEDLKRNLRVTFQKMVDYALANGVKAILISGDLFDSVKPNEDDQNAFFGAVRNAPQVDFLLIKGNHDLWDGSTWEGYPNLKLFGPKWTYYEYENVRIAGIDMKQGNCLSLYKDLLFEKDNVNIAMLHGQVSTKAGLWEISMKELKDKNIDYLALGHIHQRSEQELDQRGVYVYPGCLEGRGFDECGPHGFYLLDTEDGLKYEFVEFASMIIEELDLDVGKCKDTADVLIKFRKDPRIVKGNIYRINLVGQVELGASFNLEDLSANAQGYCLFASFKDKTETVINPKDYENDLSLRGEFVRMVLSNEKLGQEEKAKVINYGLRALDGREIDQ